MARSLMERGKGLDLLVVEELVDGLADRGGAARIVDVARHPADLIILAADTAGGRKARQAPGDATALAQLQVDALFVAGAELDDGFGASVA